MQVIRLHPDTFEAAVRAAVDVLQRGGIVLYPTDTLYGLAVDAHNPEALARLRALKGRETKKPISVVAADVEDLSTYVVMNEIAQRLADKHLPGALTLVLPAHASMPKEIALVGNVGVRVPDHLFSRALARAFGRAYTATSANRSGHRTPPTVELILQGFGPAVSEIDLVIDGGALEGGTGSTVVTVRNDSVYVLREGAIAREDLL